MNLRRQLLLVSLLTLVLPWAGCEFIRETESALRKSQQQMLSGTARAVAETLERSPEEFPRQLGESATPADQLYGHRLDSEPLVDGYFKDNQGVKGTLGFAVPDIAFEYARPGSMHAAEYYAHKIISVVRRKVRVVNHRDGDTVLLKDQFDCTNLIDFVTGEWDKNKPRFLRNQT